LDEQNVFHADDLRKIEKKKIQSETKHEPLATSVFHQTPSQARL
jgi:hypothetical protein